MANGKRAPWKVVLIVASGVALACFAGIGLTWLIGGIPSLARLATQPASPTLPATQIAPSATLHVASPTASSTPTLITDLGLLPTATGSVSLPELAAFPGGSCVPNNLVQTAIVTEVVDGDTIKVRLDEDGSVYSVRYIGLDAPEMSPPGQFMAAAASAKNEELVGGKHVMLVKDVSETDAYGRLLRYVVTDEAFVNMELVLKGYASAVGYPPDIACHSTFEQAEQEASVERLGLWAASAPRPIVATVPVPTPQSLCTCSAPDLDCHDFESHADAQACHDYCFSLGFGDVYKLDPDSDSKVCENMP
jgi:endonuclease YncB( thermonuclease family)